MSVQLSRVARRPRWPAAAVALFGFWLALSAVAAGLLAGGAHGPAACPFKRLTGVPCPTCGSLRAAAAMARGDAAGAFLCNPLAFFVCVALAAAVLMRLVFGRAIEFRFSRRQRIICWSVVAAAVAANWAYVIVFVG